MIIEEEYNSTSNEDSEQPTEEKPPELAGDAGGQPENRHPGRTYTGERDHHCEEEEYDWEKHLQKIRAAGTGLHLADQIVVRQRSPEGKKQDSTCRPPSDEKGQERADTALGRAFRKARLRQENQRGHDRGSEERQRTRSHGRGLDLGRSR